MASISNLFSVLLVMLGFAGVLFLNLLTLETRVLLRTVIYLNLEVELGVYHFILDDFSWW